MYYSAPITVITLAKTIKLPKKLDILEVENNIVRVRIFAGIVGAVTTGKNELYRSDAITQPFESMQGNPVLLKPLESRLIKLNELPGLSAIAVFQPGKQVGETQLVLQTVTDQRVNYSVGVDNYGVESTGDTSVFIPTSLVLANLAPTSAALGEFAKSLFCFSFSFLPILFCKRDI